MSRVVPGILMAVAWLLLLFYGSFTHFWLAILVLGFFSSREYLQMTCPGLGRGLKYLTMCLILFPVAFAYFQTIDSVAAGMFTSLFFCIAIVLYYYGKKEDMFTYLSMGVLGFVYLGMCLAYLVLIRALPQGDSWLIVLTAMTAGSDTGAYYAGRQFGKRQLCPSISPNKTIAGGLGGLVCGVLTALVFGLLLPCSIHPVSFIPLAALLIVIGVLGDLTESAIKRSVGAKDSGQLLRGHGGFLDRIDSLLLTGPVLYYLLLFGIL